MLKNALTFHDQRITPPPCHVILGRRQRQTAQTHRYPFRPWYVGALTPEAKDVVVILDVSDVAYLRAAQSAARSVLNTLSPLDRVSIYIFVTSNGK